MPSPSTPPRSATTDAVTPKQSAYLQEYRHIITLGIPMIIGQLGTIVLSFADTIMIGHHSTLELAAAAFVTQIFMLGILFSMGFAYGLTPMVGSSYARGDSQRLKLLVHNGVVANLCVSLLLMVIYGVFYFCLDHLGLPGELTPLMRPYYIVNWLSLPFICLANTLKQVADGTTDTRTPMWIMLGGNLVNIAGNWLLIFGKCGLPELGLLGAGLSTLLSRVLMAAVFVSIVFCTRRYRALFVTGREAVVTLKNQMLMHRMGWPLGLQMAMESGAWSLTGIVVGWIGSVALAGHQVMLSVSQIFFQIYYAISAAVSIRISHHCGRLDYGQVRTTAWAGFHLNLLVALAFSGPVFLLRHQIGWLFTTSAEVVGIVAGAILPLLLYQVSDAFQCTFCNAMRGLSYVKPLTLVSFIAYFLVSIPLSYLFGITLDGGLVGVWCSFPFGLSVAGLLYYGFFRRRYKWLMSGKA